MYRRCGSGDLVSMDVGQCKVRSLWGSGTLCVVHGERETFCAAALDGEPDVSLNTSDEMMSQTGNRQE